MIQPTKLFENFFNDVRITSTRLSNFAGDCINRLTSQNGNNDYTALIALLTPPYQALQSELGDVDTSLTVQKGATMSLNELIALVKKTMKEQEGVIANAVGGFNSPGFLEFYPHGQQEYTKATKTKLPTLLSRINTATTAHATELGTTLTATLQLFEADWNNSRDKQEQQKGRVEDNRTDRTEARQQLEIVLLTVIYAIGQKFPGDVSECLSFFSFNMLLPTPGKKQKEVSNGPVAAGQTVVAFNRTFTDAKIKVTDTVDNASLFVFIGPTANAQVNGKGKEVKAGKTKNFTLADLGDAEGTFLLIKNLSEVNDAGYKIEVKG